MMLLALKGSRNERLQKRNLDLRRKSQVLKHHSMISIKRYLPHANYICTSMLYYKEYVEKQGNELLTAVEFNQLYDALPATEQQVHIIYNQKQSLMQHLEMGRAQCGCEKRGGV